MTQDKTRLWLGATLATLRQNRFQCIPNVSLLARTVSSKTKDSLNASKPVSSVSSGTVAEFIKVLWQKLSISRHDRCMNSTAARVDAHKSHQNSDRHSMAKPPCFLWRLASSIVKKNTFKLHFLITRAAVTHKESEHDGFLSRFVSTAARTYVLPQRGLPDSVNCRVRASETQLGFSLQTCPEQRLSTHDDVQEKCQPPCSERREP